MVKTIFYFYAFTFYQLISTQPLPYFKCVDWKLSRDLRQLQSHFNIQLSSIDDNPTISLRNIHRPPVYGVHAHVSFLIEAYNTEKMAFSPSIKTEVGVSL